MSTPYNPRTLLNSQPVIVTVIDPATHRVQFQNDTALSKLGDLSGQTCHEGIAKCGVPCSFCRMPDTVATGEMRANEVALPNDQHVLVQWAPARAETGQLHIIETITDITERKRLERLAQQSHTMEALNRLASGITQDLSNALTVIRAHSQHLCDEIPAADERRSRAHHIHQAGERAAQLIQQLLQFTQPEMKDPVVLNVRHLLADCEAAMRALLPPTVTLAMTSDGDEFAIVADSLQVQRMLAKLIDNACEAMPEGGAITVRTSRRMVDVETAARSAVTPGAYVEIAVRDTGLGMSADAEAHLFEPFFTTKNGTGRGLSLPTVYSVVRQSGGFVEVITRRGAGTTVCLVLPEAGAMVAPAAGEAALPGDPQHVLVAEDDDDVRLVVADVLRHAGFVVHEARDGFEALTLLHKHPVSLVITDLLMPRMTGSQLIEQVKHLYPGMKLMLMSAVAGKGMTDSLKGVPRIDKPFAPSDLLATIKRLQSA